MDLLDAQPEFTKSFWDYLDILVNEDRIQNGRAILAQHRATFDAVEKAYGVDRHFIAAIWGVESNYATQIPQHRARVSVVEKAHGADRPCIAAIWGGGSKFATQVGERSVIRSTATRPCVGRPSRCCAGEFPTRREILARGDVKADHLKGSWA